MQHYRTLSYAFCIIFVGASIILIILLSGFRYEVKKCKQFVVTTTYIILLRYLVLEHLSFCVQAAVFAAFPQARNVMLKIFYKSISNDQNAEIDHKYNPVAYLKSRLQNLKADLELPQHHKNESLNLEYKFITQELWMYSKYFLLLLILIVWSRNSHLYYNTRTVRAILTNYRLHTYGLNEVQTLNNLNAYINNTLIQPFSEGLYYDDKLIAEPGWLHFQLAKLVGVVRLKQVRHAIKVNGMRSIYFTNANFMPGWKQSDHALHYMDKYWRTYEPWRSKHYDDFSTWLLGQIHYGSLFTYWDDEAYMALLARDVKNSNKVLTYLQTYDWLDHSTGAVFIDFTLFNVDSNIFTICTLMLEETPFASVVWELNINSAQLLNNLDEVSYLWWALVILYVLQLIQFTKAMVLKVWYEPKFMASLWNRVDLTILALNMICFLLIILRDYWVLRALKECETSKKLEYIDFRVASFLDYTFILMEGFLIAITTIRIWRILEFASMFRLFTSTLYLAAESLLITIASIQIFLMAISLATQIINGSHSENFTRYFTSVTSIMSFSFGFNSHTSPDDLSHGGNFLGFLLYIIVMFVVAVLLINLFITLILDRFQVARIDRDNQPPDQLTYWQFLYAETMLMRRWFKEHILHYCGRNKHTVRETIDNFIEKSQEAQDRQTDVGTNDQLYENDMARMRRLNKIAQILNTQMDILDRTILQILFDDDGEASPMANDIRIQNNRLTKNLGIKLNVSTKFKLFIKFMLYSFLLLLHIK